jgi:hypothetical protein
MKSAKSNQRQRFQVGRTVVKAIGSWCIQLSICFGVSGAALYGQDFGTATVPANGGAARSNPSGLPSSQGQVWREYDLRNYTSMMRDRDKPHQGVVDWVLRETGTDVWFTEPFGFMNADRDTLRVYHTPEMQKVVQGVVDKLINGTKEKQVYEARLVLLANPNWRANTMPVMRSVQTQSPGISAWLLTKEQLALFGGALKQRSDYREIQAVDLVMYNGQSEFMEQVRGRNYLRDYQRVDGGWPPYIPQTAELREGYRLQVSPVLSEDRSVVDVVIRCEIDQVEKINNVNLVLPLPNGQSQSAQIQVPQMSSWRLHERFRWPADQVLVLSCGVVSAPEGGANNTLAGQTSGLMGLFPSSTGQRADALLVIQHKGDASSHLGTLPVQSAGALGTPANGAAANGAAANGAAGAMSSSPAVGGIGAPQGPSPLRAAPYGVGVGSPAASGAGVAGPQLPGARSANQQPLAPSVSRGRY